ncbi:MAG TPA: AraC family transcriptional regulator [Polyangiaceae bacterium]|nr:AraC family transcriptional regulator [Polyangiaceae bacterium]
MDDLSAVLDAVRLRGQMYCRLEARAPWAMSAPSSGSATFHGVAKGDALLRIPGERDVTLSEGDLAVLCHGSGHTIADAVDRVPSPFADVLGSAGGGFLVRCGGRGARTVIVCGAFSTSRDGPPLLSMMPQVLHIRDNERVASLLSLLSSEATAALPGARALVSRLTEALFVEVARDWVARGKVRDDAPLAALADGRIASALAAIHGDSLKPWTVAALARKAGMSRSAFADSFARLVGAPPLAYVSRFRLHGAKVLLRESTLSVAQIAARSGFESEASLGKSFKRLFGMPPGAYRRSLSESDLSRGVRGPSA